MKNKYQEALDFIIDHTHPMCETMKDLEALDFSYNILQELVDKETPMKPITLEPCHYECRKCRSTILPIGHKRTWHKQFNKYCPNCGQRVLWED